VASGGTSAFARIRVSGTEAADVATGIAAISGNVKLGRHQ